MQKIILFAACFTISIVAACKVDTVSIFSNSMHKEIKAVIIKPGNYKKEKKGLPVVYLFHGYSGNYANWITKVPELEQYAIEFHMMIVCPDAEFSSWYFDSPVDSTYRYEIYISQEVINYVDDHYKTIADKDHRAITGLSMVGHGGLFLGLRHPQIWRCRKHELWH